MLSDILKLGDKIDVIHLDRSGRPSHNARTYVSQLMDFIDNEIIHIATPIANSTPIILNVDENYNLCFYTAKGLYQCNGTILKNMRQGNIIIAVVRVTSSLQKFQRRQYFRMECITDISYRLITREEEILESKMETNDFQSDNEKQEIIKRLQELKSIWILATMRDLSGGGIRFTSGSLHNQGDNIQVKLDLAFNIGIKKLILNAAIISGDRIVNKSGLYEYRVGFTDIKNREREDLIKYIFEQERKRR